MNISDELDAQILEERRRREPAKATYGRAGEKCAKCERALRPFGTKPGQFPGTLKHAGRGMCASCLREFYQKELT